MTMAGFLACWSRARASHSTCFIPRSPSVTVCLVLYNESRRKKFARSVSSTLTSRPAIGGVPGSIAVSVSAKRLRLSQLPIVRWIGISRLVSGSRSWAKCRYAPAVGGEPSVAKSPLTTTPAGLAVCAAISATTWRK